MEISWTWLGLCAAGLLIAACVLGFRKGFVKEVVSAFFMILSFLLVWVINPYVNSFLREYTPLYTTVQQSSQEFVESQTGNRKSVDRTEQSQIVENLNIPDLLKNKLKENNTAETYRYLAVNTFTEYISDSLATMAVNGISFLLSYVLSVVVIKLLGYILNILSNLPVIHGVNKLAGAVVGLGKCVIFIWIALLILTLLCNTQIGKTGMALVQKDTFLNFLYNEDIFVKIFMNVFYS